MKDQPIKSWLDELGSRSPAPGGGAAAALAAATAASLVSMVAEYTTGERWADREERMKAVAVEAQGLADRALELADADAAAFAKVGEAYSLPRESEAEKAARESAIQSSLQGAARPPREVGELALRVIALAEGLVEQGNPNVVSDVSVAASLAGAAIEAGIVNVEINRSMITDTAVQADLSQAADELRKGIEEADEIVTRVRTGLEKE